MPTTLPKDSNGDIIPAMALVPDGSHKIAATSGASARNATPFQSQKSNFGKGSVVSVFATVPVFIRFGDSTITAANTDHYFPENTYYDFATKEGVTHLAVRAVAAGGDVYLSEKY